MTDTTWIVLATPASRRKDHFAFPSVVHKGTMLECIRYAGEMFGKDADLDTFQTNVVPVYVSQNWVYWIIRA